MPVWWRGTPAPPAYDGHGTQGTILTGDVTSAEVEAAPVTNSGLRGVRLFRARVLEQELDLSDLHLHVRWSELEVCRLTQRARPVLNEHGATAQGSLGAAPSVYRRCVFRRGRFRTGG